MRLFDALLEPEHKVKSYTTFEAFTFEMTINREMIFCLGLLT